MSPNDQTLEVYSRLATKYREKTQGLDTTASRQMLTSRLYKGAHILDAGCGWGRDARNFLDEGFSVTAFDGSSEMAAEARRYLDVPVATLRLQDVTYPADTFDGVWARASLLHLDPVELLDAMTRLLVALKPDGYLYASFKEGEGERFDEQGRYYLDMTRDNFCSLLGHTGGALEESCVTGDQYGRPERWLHLLIRK